MYMLAMQIVPIHLTSGFVRTTRFILILQSDFIHLDLELEVFSKCFYAPATKSREHINLPLSVRSSVWIQIHGLSGYLLLQFWIYSFNILYDVYTHNQWRWCACPQDFDFHQIFDNDRQLDLVIFYAPATELILDRIIPISPQVIPLYLQIRIEKLKVLSVYKLSMI